MRETDYLNSLEVHERDSLNNEELFLDQNRMSVYSNVKGM